MEGQNVPRKRVWDAEKERKRKAAYRARKKQEQRRLKEEGKLVELSTADLSNEELGIVSYTPKDPCGFRNPMIPIQKCVLEDGHLGAHHWR